MPGRFLVVQPRPLPQRGRVGVGAITPHPQPLSRRGRGALRDRGTASFVLEVRQGREAGTVPDCQAGEG